MKTTLQNRLAILMISFSVVFIVSFSSVLLWGHKNNIDRFLYFKTRYSVFIIKETFSNVTKDKEPNSQILGSMLSSLKKLGVVEDAMILNSQGYILARTDANFFKPPSKSIIGKILLSNKAYISSPEKNYIYNLIKLSDNLVIVMISSASAIQRALNEITIPIVAIIVFVTLVNFILATLLSKIIISPISKLSSATTNIAKGALDQRVEIKTEDELGVLATNFNFMAKELVRMKEKAENANPLTKLPGNIVIQEETEKRIKQNRKFMVIYCDLDNFKAFNDKYGIHKGDEAIKLTASVFKDAINKEGTKEDFIGHEGGDDFLLITEPQRSESIANYITSEFDKQIRSLYSEEDLSRGFIEAKARNADEVIKFPIMTISLSGVTNASRDIGSYSEVTNIAAGLKKKSKSIPSSCFVIDKRSS